MRFGVEDATFFIRSSRQRIPTKTFGCISGLIDIMRKNKKVAGLRRLLGTVSEVFIDSRSRVGLFLKA